MADTVVNYQCPNCTGPLRFDSASGKLVCDYCDSSYEPAEIEGLYREKEEQAKAAAARENNWGSSHLSEDWGEASEGMKTYKCPSCGAELICDGETAATCCPYCGNKSVIPGQFAGALKPDYILPFKKDKNAAMEALKKHYGGKLLLPKSFADGNHIEEIQGVYVPFWMFDAEAEGTVTFHAQNSRTTRTAEEEITTTEHYFVRRSGRMAFEKVPADASSRMPDGHMDAIEPFDYSEIKPFSTVYLPGFLADKYDVDAEQCGERMEERCESALESALVGTVTGYGSRSMTGKQLQVEKGDVHYAMLPVWLLSTKWKDKNFLFAMNGQTGKLVGDLPMDMGKYWAWFLGVSAAMALIINGVMKFQLEEASLVIFGILLPLLIGFITVSVMAGSLKSVVRGDASRYTAEGGLKLTDRTDRHVRTTVSRRPIPKDK